MASEAADASDDGDSEADKVNVTEQGLKTLCFAKLTDSIETSTKAKVAVEQMIRVQMGGSRHRQQQQQNMNQLQRYKILVQSLNSENDNLRKQLALLTDGEPFAVPVGDSQNWTRHDKSKLRRFEVAIRKNAHKYHSKNKHKAF